MILIVDMINNKKLNPIVIVTFIIQSYFRVRKDVRLNSTHTKKKT